MFEINIGQVRRAAGVTPQFQRWDMSFFGFHTILGLEYLVKGTSSYVRRLLAGEETVVGVRQTSAVRDVYAE